MLPGLNSHFEEWLAYQIEFAGYRLGRCPTHAEMRQVAEGLGIRYKPKSEEEQWDLWRQGGRHEKLCVIEKVEDVEDVEAAVFHPLEFDGTLPGALGNEGVWVRIGLRLGVPSLDRMLPMWAGEEEKLEELSIDAKLIERYVAADR